MKRYILLLSACLGLLPLRGSAQGVLDIYVAPNLYVGYRERALLKLHGREEPLEGFLRIPTYQSPYSIRFAPGEKGKARTYSTDEIEYLDLVVEGGGNVRLVPKQVGYEGKKEHLPRFMRYAHPILMQCVYEGKHASAYVRYSVSYDDDSDKEELSYFYGVEGSGEVIHYWDQEIGTDPVVVGLRSYLVRTFGKFPGMEDAILCGDYDAPRLFTDDPTSVIIFLDQHILPGGDDPEKGDGNGSPERLF